MPSGVITITGFPLINFRIRIECFTIFVSVNSTTNNVKIGTSPYNTGTCVSDMGIQASSAAISVTANSKGCNSPNCFLPINLIAISKKKYIIIDLVNTISIIKLCENTVLLCINSF